MYFSKEDDPRSECRLLPDEVGVGDVDLSLDGLMKHAGRGFDVDADGARCKMPIQ